MGMSIDESIKILEYKNPHYSPVCHSDEAVQVAIETMRKYQRIQAIVEAWEADVDIDSCDCMADIYEVVGDGNNSD